MCAYISYILYRPTYYIYISYNIHILYTYIIYIYYIYAYISPHIHIHPHMMDWFSNQGTGEGKYLQKSVIVFVRVLVVLVHY